MTIAAPGAVPASDPYLRPVLLDPQGRAIRLADFKGKVRIFDVWATWCGPCRMGIPQLNTLYERYRDRGLVVVGISVDGDPADVARFVQEVPIHYPHGMMNRDAAALFEARGESMSIPITFVIDRSGKLRRRFIGLVGGGRLEKEISALF